MSGFQKFGKGIQRPFPKAAIMAYPAQGLLHGLGIEFEMEFTARTAAFKQPRIFQHAQVLRDCGQRHVKRLG